MIYTTSDAASHIISFALKKEVIKQIPSKYVNAYTKEEVDALIVTGGDSSATDLFIAAGQEINTIPQFTIDGFAYQSNYGIYAYHLMPTDYMLVVGKTYHVTWDDKQYTFTAASFTSAEGYDCVGIGNQMVFGGENSGEVCGIVYNKTLNYMHFYSLETLTSHTVRVYEVIDKKQINPEYVDCYTKAEVDALLAAQLNEIKALLAGQ
jgi:hypothetical protein